MISVGLGQTVVTPTPAVRIRAQAPMPLFLGGLGQNSNGGEEIIYIKPTPASIGINIGVSLFSILLLGGTLYLTQCQALKRCR